MEQCPSLLAHHLLSAEPEIPRTLRRLTVYLSADDISTLLSSPKQDEYSPIL
jgi:hypothetical protein